MFPDFLQSGNEWINDNNAVLVDLCGNSSSSPSLQCSYAFLTLLPSFAAWYPSTPLNRWFHALEDETRLNGLRRGHNLCLWTLSQITASCRHLIVLLISATILWVLGHFLHPFLCPAYSLATKHTSKLPCQQLLSIYTTGPLPRAKERGDITYHCKKRIPWAFAACGCKLK